VVGTILRLEVDQQARRGMRLEVIEGRVELGNVAGASVMVDSGQSAIAATGIPLVVEAIGRSPGGAAATAAAISAPYAHAGTWEDVTPAGIDLSPDFPSASQNYGVQDVLADPRHPGTFYAFVCYQGCWRSVDWGSSWTHISSDGHLEQGRPWGEAMAPDGSYMLATTGYGPAGAWRSTDQGRSWANIGMGPHGVPEMFDVEPGNADHAVASFHAEDAISESQDGGRTWVDKGPAGTGPASYVFILTPTSWLAIGQIGNHAVGTRRTVDAGASWNPVGPMEHALGNEQIAIDTKNGTIYAPGLGTYRSSDGGASFTKVSTINGSAIFATASAIYSLDGGATNAFNQPFFCSSPRADGATWTAAPTPAAMTNGCKRAAVAFDAARGHWVVVTGKWLAGIWRFVEK
jgi:photosystem II stability/assembly factor-like uncharacterized protein